MSDDLETFASGDPLKFAVRGARELSSQQVRSCETLKQPIRQRYGTEVSEETANVLSKLKKSQNPHKLVSAIRHEGLNEVEDYNALFDSSDTDGEEYDLGDVVNAIDKSLSNSLCDREEDAVKASSKSDRESVYIPELLEMAEGGTVYMAKTLSSVDKVRMAWDLNDNNQVVVVDEYDKWERLLGWEKLKSLPHGKNKIREEYGDRLSDEVLEIVAGEQVGDTETKADSDDDSSSRGRRTRTKPSEEVLNVARASAHKRRRKLKSKTIADEFENDRDIGYHIDTLILFPSTCDLNMTEHWWIPGSRGDGKNAAIANCNKGTFEYLNQYEQVWHVEDYLDQADEYVFETSAGRVTMGTAPTDNLVIHILEQESQKRMMRTDILKSMPDALHTYVEEEIYKNVGLPHEDDMVYAPITKEDAFWLRPSLLKQTSPDDGDALVLKGGCSVRDIPTKKSISSDYKLYARARLNEWDFSSPELDCLDDASSLYMDLDEGAYELLETLGRLHDRGENTFSQTPEQRWK